MTTERPAYIIRYEKSAKGRARQRRYRRSAKGKAAEKRHSKYKYATGRNAEICKRWRESPHGKTLTYLYNRSPLRKLKSRLAKQEARRWNPTA